MASSLHPPVGLEEINKAASQRHKAENGAKGAVTSDKRQFFANFSKAFYGVFESIVSVLNDGAWRFGLKNKA
ncbi:hypothetical protein [Salipiger abyssi]|uniref:hypothetical protein n=1 Tax=Salipiger abyssi TaxID=1250539 RepID=UPI001A8FB5A7|nr:hypothetical protein [Salipiger abyssi]MBN9886410.1 hypothetical protein [Salipiger abyssi]